MPTAISWAPASAWRSSSTPAGTQKVYSFSHTDPYTSIDNVSRTFSLRYSDVTQFVSASSDFSSKTLTAGLEFGYPITEFQALRFGIERAALGAADHVERQRAAGAELGAAQRQARISRSAVDDLGQHLRVLRQQVHHFELTAGWYLTRA